MLPPFRYASFHIFATSRLLLILMLLRHILRCCQLLRRYAIDAFHFRRYAFRDIAAIIAMLFITLSPAILRHMLFATILHVMLTMFFFSLFSLRC